MTTEEKHYYWVSLATAQYVNRYEQEGDEARRKLIEARLRICIIEHCPAPAQITQREVKLLARAERAEAERDALAQRIIGQEEQLKALTKTDCGFGGYIDCLLNDKLKAEAEVEKLVAALETEHADNRKLQRGATVTEFEFFCVRQEARLRAAIDKARKEQP